MRVALLVGCSDHNYPSFQQLPARQNIDALAGVLTDSDIGDFTAEKLLNEESHKVAERIDEFFANRKPDDLLLLYFSCHGILDPAGQLHFTTVDTREDRLESTGISAQRVKTMMDQSRSQKIVLLLDCCYSGAFDKGLTRGIAGAEKILEQLGGRGRVVITASDKLELAHESEFTDAVVRGLRTGDADRDGDGHVSVYELYQYVHEQVRANKPQQTPTWSADEMCGEFYLAKNPHVPLPLPNDLQQALRSDTVWMRRGAIDGLQRLLAGDHPAGQKRTARQALAHVRKVDPDLDIQEAARETVGGLPPVPAVVSPRPASTRNRLTGAGLAVAVLACAIILPPVFAPNPIPCSPRAKTADGVLSMGTLLPKTGAFVYSGPALDAGVHLAMEDISTAGGIPSSAVNLDAANQRDEGNPFTDTASQSSDALLAGGVDAIIGPATSPVALKVIDKITCAGVIMFSPGNTSPVFSTYPAHDLYFRTTPSSAFEGYALGKLVATDGNSTAVVISRDDTFGNPLRETTVKTIQKFGVQILDSFHYDPSTLDHDNDIQRIKAKNPDAIVLIGFAETAPILASMIKQGLGPRNKRVYVPGATMTNTLVGQVSPQDPGALAGLKGTPLDTGGDEFAKRLREVNPGLRDLTYAAQAYDAVVITVLAAALAGTDEPSAIAKEINGVTNSGEKCTSFAACMSLVKDHKDINYVGPSGPLEFTDSHEPRSATYMISEIQPDSTVKPVTSERISP